MRAQLDESFYKSFVKAAGRKPFKLTPADQAKVNMGMPAKQPKVCCPCSPPWVRNPELDASLKQKPAAFLETGGKPDHKEKQLMQDYQEFSRR